MSFIELENLSCEPVCLQCDFRCLHKTRSSNTALSKLSCRNTGCMATMKVILKKTDFARKDREDVRKSRLVAHKYHVSQYMCYVMACLL